MTFGPNSKTMCLRHAWDVAFPRWTSRSRERVCESMADSILLECTKDPMDLESNVKDHPKTRKSASRLDLYLESVECCSTS